MMGFLIDENEFEVSPAVNRVLQVFEVDTRTIKRGIKKELPNNKIELDALFKLGVTITSEKFDYTTDITIDTTTNVDSYDVFINNDYYGGNVNSIQVNDGDVVRFEIIKNDNSLESNIKLISQII
jgi:FtsP/CotA-like multicopper oxidase with cupredoxin domain